MNLRGALVGLLLPLAVHCIFEDQAGQRQWKKENLGNIKNAVYQGRRMYVATESNVVAALGIKSGKTEWRHVLPEGQKLSEVFHSLMLLKTVNQRPLIKCRGLRG